MFFACSGRYTRHTAHTRIFLLPPGLCIHKHFRQHIRVQKTEFAAKLVYTDISHILNMKLAKMPIKKLLVACKMLT